MAIEGYVRLVGLYMAIGLCMTMKGYVGLCRTMYGYVWLLRAM